MRLTVLQTIWMQRVVFFALAQVLGLPMLRLLSSEAMGAKNPEEGRNAVAVPVQVQPVEKKSYQEYGEFYGAVHGIEEAALVTYAGGRVQKIKVKNGDRVKKGDKLCDIDAATHQVAYQSAALRSKIAKQKYHRMNSHLKGGRSSQLAVDEAQLEWLEARAAFTNAKRNREGALCLSPIAGQVVAVHISDFQEMPPQAKTITVARLDKVKVEVGIAESESDGYKVGNPVEVFRTDNPSKKWRGTVDSIAGSVDESKTFKVEVVVENKDGSLKPGSTVRTRILRFDLPNQIVVPTSAIITLATERVVMIAVESKAVRKPVVVQSGDEQQTLILKGLLPGEKLIVRGHYQTTDGSPIKIQKK